MDVNIILVLLLVRDKPTGLCLDNTRFIFLFCVSANIISSVISSLLLSLLSYSFRCRGFLHSR